jgi:hypothetical protein
MADWHPFYAAIRTAFNADAPLKAIAPATQWFADQMPDRRTFPALRYVVLADTPHQRLASGDNVTAEVQIDAYGQRQDETTVSNLANAVVRVLDRVSLTATGYSDVRTMCTGRPQPFKEDPYFRLRMRFRFYGSAA